jgi:hypothetical protein
VAPHTFPCLPSRLHARLRSLQGAGRLGHETVLARMSEMRIALPLSVAATMRWRNNVHPRKLLVSVRAGIILSLSISHTCTSRALPRASQFKSIIQSAEAEAAHGALEGHVLL